LIGIGVRIGIGVSIGIIVRIGISRGVGVSIGISRGVGIRICGSTCRSTCFTILGTRCTGASGLCRNIWRICHGNK